MDFYTIVERSRRDGGVDICPDFIVRKSKDLMVRGKDFYAVWNDEEGLWSTDEYDIARLVDRDLWAYYDQFKATRNFNGPVRVRTMAAFSTRSWAEFRKYVSSISDTRHQLDEHLTFANTPVKKEDYVSRRLGYSLEKGPYDAWDELVGTLYDPEEREKIEWTIGAIVSGDSRDIQKFLVFYGAAGAGKSTILNIIEKLFDGYYVAFNSKELTGTNNAFATEVFRSNPLVAIEHDGDLSRIEDNTKLNSIVSHENMVINQKNKAQYMARANCFLLMATNRPVKITDAKSGVIRRLIDVHPSGRKIPPKKYQALMTMIDFQLGAIAQHCLDIYRELGKNYYNEYVPFDMIAKTDVFFNFVENSFDVFKEQDGVALKQAYTMYKAYCDEALVEWRMPMYKFREELKNYFSKFHDIYRSDGKQVRSYYEGFLVDKFSQKAVLPEEFKSWLALDATESLLDILLADCPAQYAIGNSGEEVPGKRWSSVKTKLSDLDTRKVHYVKPPVEHIVIDFDLKDDSGNKCFEKNLEAASSWPPTYAEISKGGNGIHLHYIYEGDPTELNRVYSPGIEVKVFNGNSSLRRRVSKCNTIPVASIASGLPKKEGKRLINHDVIKTEKGLRLFVESCLAKKHHGATRPEIDFIFAKLKEAYDSGVVYDLTFMRPLVLAFAANSSHQADYCIKKVSEMPFASETISDSKEDERSGDIVFYDVEVFPNLFLVNWKKRGAGKECFRMINPKPSDIGMLLDYKMVGFNCRRYDNHILYAWYSGACKTNQDLYELSSRLVSGNGRNGYFSEAYNLSYTDVYDFCSKKQSLKKWEIELGIHHQELGLPWDKPVPEEQWERVAKYCDNDVVATEAVFEARQADWDARKILADISGLTVNDTTNSHTTKIIFGNDRHPQNQFVYTDLSEMFPGYSFENGVSTYRGEKTGEGGYVYAEPGAYHNVALLDIASMHPTSIENLNLFGPYTARFSELKRARILIKHGEYEEAGKLFDGKLAKYLTNKEKSDALAYALKIAINSVYGLTSASFDNPFRDPRNKDNVVAKRGALFMIDLKHAVQERGFTVAHIKTDSIKIPNATPEIIQFVMDFGKLYGYDFEHEATYDRMCLVNDAVYIARYLGGKHDGEWTATGAQFQKPYVFKTLFSKEPLDFSDMCETMSVTTSLYLDMNENLPDVSAQEKALAKLQKSSPDATDEIEALKEEIARGHNYVFVGKAGLFTPVVSGCGGGILVREKDGKYNSAGGAKGYRWMEAEVVQANGMQDCVDRSYYDAFVNAAVDDISVYADFEAFQNAPPGKFEEDDTPPFDLEPSKVPCGDPKYETCVDCANGEGCERKCGY